jgi:conjugal transfer pilus assembly protein TraV
MKRLSSVVMLTSTALLVVGCSGLSGLGGSSDYACPLPDGSSCKSMAQAYRDTYRNPYRNPQPAGAPGTAVTPDSSAPAPAAMEPEAPWRAGVPLPAEVGTPLLSGPRLMRVLIAPWTDGEDHLMEARRVVVKLSDSRWRLEHFKASLYTNVGPKPAAASAGAAPAPAPAPASVSVSGPRTE